jgi:hypothetical protein
VIAAAAQFQAVKTDIATLAGELLDGQIGPLSSTQRHGAGHGLRPILDFRFWIGEARVPASSAGVRNTD